MCCERLICAACSGAVADARCGVCAESKSRVHGGAAHVHVPEWLLALALLVVTLTVLAAL